MENSTGYRSFLSSFAGVKGQRVKINSSGGIDLDGATNGFGIGVLMRDCQAGEYVTVKLITAPGTIEVQVTGPVTPGAVLYPAANGAYATTSTASNTPTLRAIEAATAAGDIIEAIDCTPAN